MIAMVTEDGMHCMYAGEVMTVKQEVIGISELVIIIIVMAPQWAMCTRKKLRHSEKYLA